MRYLFLLFLMLSSLLASDRQQVTLGLGAYLQTQPYQGVKTKLTATPVIFYDNSLLYVRWTRFGVYFLGDKSEDLLWGFSLTAQPRIYGYDSNDIGGMEKRENSIEGGIAFSAKKDNFHIELMALTDILDRHNTWVYNAGLGYDLKLGNFSIYPSLLASYQSSKFTNYYYGITNNEANRKSISSYTPNSGLQLGVQTYVEYPLSKKLSALFNLRADRISSEAKNSPLVNDSYIYSGLASLIYRFSY